MNVRLLETTKQDLLAHPEKLDMDHWCGTSYCIGGRAAILAGWLKPRAKTAVNVSAWEPKARVRKNRNFPLFVRSDSTGSPEAFSRLLRLDENQAARLFYTANWPMDLVNRYRLAPSPSHRAVVVAERIDRFIASDGRE